MTRKIKESLEVAREIVVSFWRERSRQAIGNVETIAELYRVQSAKPEELVHDYEAIVAILEKALKQIRESEKNDNRNDEGQDQINTNRQADECTDERIGGGDS